MARLSWLSWLACVGGLALALPLANANWAQADDDDEEEVRVVRFSKGDVGKLPKGWKADKTGKSEGSVWKVVADHTSPSKTGCVLAQTAQSPRRVFNLCVLKDSKYRDVEVKVAFKAVKGKVDQGGGIVWRYQNANNYYIARMNPLERNYRFYKVVNGKRTQLATKEGLKVPAGEWHTLEIECEGNKIECELDGKDILEVVDDTFTKAGKVGLWTKADAQKYFDNFVVEVEDNDKGDKDDDKDDDDDDDHDDHDDDDKA